MMQSAYARSGNGPMYQVLALGLGMDRSVCAHTVLTAVSP
jgi:hypothetical protein